MYDSDKANLPTPSSLMEGVEQAACAAPDIARLRRKSALLSLRIPDDLDLAQTVYDRVASNWIGGQAVANKDRSRENWRWTRKNEVHRYIRDSII